MSMDLATLLPESIFRAYDIRGIVGKTLSAKGVFQIGRAIGSEALARGDLSVVTGRDGRLSGAELMVALNDGIASTGCDVITVGEVPTPVVYFAMYHFKTGSCVALTGSHNPPDYNGLKVVSGGETLFGDLIQGLRQRVLDDNLSSGSGKIEEKPVVDHYLERILADVKLNRSMNVVVDCGNGVAGGVAPLLLEKLGCVKQELFCEVDGNFPNHHPDPSKPENLVDLITAVKAGDDELGLAFDGDGDRLGVVDRDGQVIWPDRQMILYARDVLSRNPKGKIVYDVKCTRKLHQEILASGGEPIMGKTGHSFIKAKIKETGALLAGEMSGHIFFKERWYVFDDALYTMARLLEILSNDRRTPTEVFASLPDTVNTPEINIQMQEGETFTFIDKLVAKAHFPEAKISTIDGLRVDFEDSWGLVRSSNTTPVLVLRFEANNQQALEKVQAGFRELMLSVDPDLGVPF